MQSFFAHVYVFLSPGSFEIVSDLWGVKSEPNFLGTCRKIQTLKSQNEMAFEMIYTIAAETFSTYPKYSLNTSTSRSPLSGGKVCL